MKYQTGDIVVIVTNMKKFLNVLVSDIIENTADKKVRYCGYTEFSYSALVFMEKQIVSGAGSSKDIITDTAITQLFDPHTPPNELFKSIAIHLIRTTDKYDLQLLSKCNHLRTVLGLDNNLSIKAVLHKLNLKLQINSPPTITG